MYIIHFVNVVFHKLKFSKLEISFVINYVHFFYFLSFFTGGIIFISAGLNLAQGLGWNQGTEVEYTDHFKFSWFIGVIIGTILAVPIVNLFPKKLMMV